MTGTIRRTMTSTRNRLLQDENEYYGGNADGAKDSRIYAGKWHCRFGGVADNLGGVCLRAYTQYDGEVDTDEGEDPEAAVSGWSDVADYMDEHMI